MEISPEYHFRNLLALEWFDNELVGCWKQIASSLHWGCLPISLRFFFWVHHPHLKNLLVAHLLICYWPTSPRRLTPVLAG